jgi:FKBP-type peptidyl-prolyl cis-trans isomerase FklB
MRAVMAVYTKELAEKQADAMRKLADKNRQEGDFFFADNKKKEGVKTLASGLQYKVMSEGNGKSPKAADTITANYRGMFINGIEFDSSYQRGEPATFPVNGVIPGWTEALQLMKEGAKWQLFIPSNLAYGEKGAGKVIGPNAALIFEIELISIKDSENKPEIRQ